ncbi:MAG: isoprenylcysteine carboxylmethyltransferase family protein [Pseudomonadota bacterium]
MGAMIKWLDIPPIWLLVFLALAWVQSSRLPVPFSGGWFTDLLGGLLAGGGLLLALLAVLEMRKAKTTVIPHLEPNVLVDSGVFGLTRNPIYLGDAMILAGLILYWEAWPSLILLPLFVWLITDRFILPEEQRLHAAFSNGFEAYRQRVRRWI